MAREMKSLDRPKARTKKRRMLPIRVDPVNDEIITTTRFYKLAQDPRSVEYAQLQRIKAENPTCRVVRHTIAKSEGKESYKGLTYSWMSEYIKTYADAHIKSEALAELERQIKLSECHSKKYPTIKKWFLDTFPEVKEEYGKALSVTKETKSFDLEPISGSLAA